MKIGLFAKIREQVGKDHCQLDITEATKLSELRVELQKALPEQAELFVKGKALFAVNQTLINNEEHCVSKDDEVACFPPVTGG